VATETKAGPAPATYNDLVDKAQARASERLGKLATDYREGRIKYEPFVAAFKAELTESVRLGHKLGIAQAKRVYPPWSYSITSAERAAADNIVGKQLDYFLGFRGDIRKLEALGPLSTAIDARAAMYGGSVRWAAEEAKIQTDGDKLLVWIRHAGDSCVTCIANDGKKQTARQWKEGGVWPGHATACLTNCRCSLDPVEAT